MKRRKGLLDEEKFLPPLPEQLPRGVSSLPGYGQTSPIAQGLLGFTGRQPTYSVMDPEAQKMSEAYRLGEQASVASQLYGSVAPFAVASTMANAQRAGSLLSPLTVFHGSPHKFSKFDASKIGTGEGAQAYGHGIYLAENPAVASGYRGSVTKFDIPDKSPLKGIVTLIASRGEEGEVLARNAYKDLGENLEPTIKQAKKIVEEQSSLYTVDLPDEQIAKMLDWDKPLSQQSKYVKDALSRIGITVDEKRVGEFDDALLSALSTDKPSSLPKQPINLTGEQIYKKISKPNPRVNVAQSALASGDDPVWALKTFYPDITDEQISQTLAAARKGSTDVITSSILKDAGIPGIRYLDEGSRAAKKGTSNFVVFPGEESKLRIMEVNGRPVVIDEEELRRSGLLGQGVAR